jgi:hypothetical protein
VDSVRRPDNEIEVILKASERGGHSHGCAGSRSQRPANGCSLSTPEPSVLGEAVGKLDCVLAIYVPPASPLKRFLGTKADQRANFASNSTEGRLRAYPLQEYGTDGAEGIETSNNRGQS